MNETIETLKGEGDTKLIQKTRVRECCEECGEPAHFKHTFLLEGTRSNPASKAYRRDDCSWCEDDCRFVCAKHELNRTPPDGYVWCSTFPCNERFAHMFLRWVEMEIKEPRFLDIQCSQCGRSFGPGNRGFSSCKDHQP